MPSENLKRLRRNALASFSDGAAWATQDWNEVHNPTPPEVLAANRDRKKPKGEKK